MRLRNSCTGGLLVAILSAALAHPSATAVSQSQDDKPRSFPPPPPPPGVPGAGDIKWVYAETTFTVSGNAKTPKRIKDVRPKYPPMAITLGASGTVIVRATIDRQGRVVDARVVESVHLLDQTTIDAVKQWRFEPSTVPEAGVVITVKAVFAPK